MGFQRRHKLVGMGAVLGLAGLAGLAGVLGGEFRSREPSRYIGGDTPLGKLNHPLLQGAEDDEGQSLPQPRLFHTLLWYVKGLQWRKGLESLWAETVGVYRCPGAEA